MSEELNKDQLPTPSGAEIPVHIPSETAEYMEAVDVPEHAIHGVLKEINDQHGTEIASAGEHARPTAQVSIDHAQFEVQPGVGVSTAEPASLPQSDFSPSNQHPGIIQRFSHNVANTLGLVAQLGVNIFHSIVIEREYGGAHGSKYNGRTEVKNLPLPESHHGTT